VYSYRGRLKLLPVGFLPAVKPSWGARALICAAVTDDVRLADGTIGEPALFIVGVTDGIGLADRAVGVPASLLVGTCDDDRGNGLVGGAG
jgi:hypothetical protein